MKKIIAFLILILTLYVILVFKSPELASKIESWLWLNWLNDFITWSKETIDTISNNTPTPDDIIDGYNKTLSWALELRDTIKTWLEDTKETIDTIRETANSVENKINEAKDVVDSTIDTVNTTIDTVNDLSDKVNDITNVLNNTWTTN